MINEKVKFIVPEHILENWQEILNILAQIANIPAALILQNPQADFTHSICPECMERLYPEFADKDA